MFRVLLLIFAVGCAGQPHKTDLPHCSEVTVTKDKGKNRAPECTFEDPRGSVR